MKVLYVTTISNTINAFLIPHIRMLIESGYEVDVACNLTQPLDQEVFDLGARFYQVPFERSPINKNNLLAYKELKKIVNDYDIIHTHTPVASMVVRLACRGNSNIKVFYTAHGFHFYKGAPLKNWLIYYPIEKWLSRYTDLLITLNKEDFYRASKFKTKNTRYIPGVGIDIKEIAELEIDKKNKRKELGIPLDSFVVLSVGELNDNKNHQVVIKALSLLDIPNVHYVICGQGNNIEYLINLSKELNVDNRMHFLGYRNDIIEICKISDVFVFPSKREGLPVSIMEAMANKLPVVCSNIRGNSDLIENQKGGYLVEPKNVEGFSKYIKRLTEDSKLRVEMGEFNYKKIEVYSIDNVLYQMEDIYKNQGVGV